MTTESQQTTEPVIIKKYANRRLYNTDTSSYVTLDDLAIMVKAEQDFVVFDAKTGEELTHSVLTQIIFEQEAKGHNLLPIRFLRQLIGFYGDSIEKIVPSYLEISLDSLIKDQDRIRKQFSSTFGANAFDAMHEQTQQNIAMFERALSMFSPFSAPGGMPDDQPSDLPQSPAQKQEKAHPGKTDPAAQGDELQTLKDEMQAMQEKLDQLSRR